VWGLRVAFLGGLVDPDDDEEEKVGVALGLGLGLTPPVPAVERTWHTLAIQGQQVRRTFEDVTFSFGSGDRDRVVG